MFYYLLTTGINYNNIFLLIHFSLNSVISLNSQVTHPSHTWGVGCDWGRAKEYCNNTESA